MVSLEASSPNLTLPCPSICPLSLVPTPHSKEPSSGSTPAALDAVGPLRPGPTGSHPDHVPWHHREKNFLESCGSSLARGSARGIGLLSKRASVSQWLFPSPQGAVTKWRCWQQGRGAPHARGAGRTGWHISLLLPGPAVHTAKPHPSSWAAPAERVPKDAPLTHHQLRDVQCPHGCQAHQGAPANVSPAATCPAPGFVSGPMQQTIVWMQREDTSPPRICADGCLIS